MQTGGIGDAILLNPSMIYKKGGQGSANAHSRKQTRDKFGEFSGMAQNCWILFADIDHVYYKQGTLGAASE